MNNILLIVLTMVMASCGNQKVVTKESTQEKEIELNKTAMSSEDEFILLGKADKSGLLTEPFSSWYNENYEEYDIDATSVSSLKHLLKDVKIKIFMGTWCSDSQREVPHFYKIMKAVGYDESKLELITVSREKDTPAGHEVGLNINYVPTFIFSRNDTEINRIVEYPVTSLEKDMIDILTGQAYTPSITD